MNETLLQSEHAMDREIRQLKFQLKGAENIIKKLREQLTFSTQVNFTELLPKYTREVETNQQLRNDFDASKLQCSSKIMDLLPKLDASDSTLVLRDAKIEELMSKLATEAEANSRLKEELALALQIVNDSDLIAIMEKYEKLSRENESLMEAVHDSDRDKTLLEKLESMLADEVSSFDKAKLALEASEIECSKFRSESNVLKDELKSLKDAVAVLLDEVESSKSAILKLEYYLALNDSDLIAIMEKYEKLSKENESLMEAAHDSDRDKMLLEKLESMLADEVSSFDKAKLALEASEIECSKFRSESNVLKDELKSLKDAVAVLLDEVESSKSAILKLEYYLALNDSDLIAIMEKYEKLSEENESLMEAVHDSDRDKSLLESRLRVAELAVKSPECVRRLKLNQAENETTIAELTAKLAAEVEVNNRLHDELGDSKAQCETTTTKLAAEVEANNRLYDELDASKAQCETITTKLAVQVKANNRLCDELCACKAQYETAIAELTAKLAAEVKANNKLIGDHAYSSQTITKFEILLTELGVENEHLREALARANESASANRRENELLPDNSIVSELEAKLSAEVEANKQLRDDLSYTKVQYDEKIAETTANKRLHDELGDSKAQYEATIAELMAKLSSLMETAHDPDR